MSVFNFEKIVHNPNFIIGDQIPKEDTEKLLQLIGGEEDEDGFIPYKPFLDKLCGKVDYKAPPPQ